MAGIIMEENMKNKNFFKLPNQLVMDNRLSFSARHIGAILYSTRNALGGCKKSLKELAELSGYSVSTVCAAVKMLQINGYVTVTQNYWYNTNKAAVIYGCKSYQMNLNCLKNGFTMVPRSALKQEDLKDSAMIMYLYLYVAAGNRNRAWPSIQKISDAIGAAKSTICRGLQKLKCLRGFLVEHCIRKNGTYSSNSYFVQVKRVECVNFLKLNQQAGLASPPVFIVPAKQLKDKMVR